MVSCLVRPDSPDWSFSSPRCKPAEGVPRRSCWWQRRTRPHRQSTIPAWPGESRRRTSMGESPMRGGDICFAIAASTAPRRPARRSGTLPSDRRTASSRPSVSSSSRVAQLAVEAGGAAAQRRLLLDQDDFLPAFGRFERGRHPADAADDEDGLVGCDDSADAGLREKVRGEGRCMALAWRVLRRGVGRGVYNRFGDGLPTRMVAGGDLRRRGR